MRTRLIAGAVLVACTAATAQSSPFLPQELQRKLSNEISGEIAYDHLRTLTQFHVPNGAGAGFKAEAAWIAQKAREYGLEDVTIHQLPTEEVAWTPLGGELWLLEPDENGKYRERKLGSWAEAAVSIADNSRPAKLEAELVDVGAGVGEKDYEGKDIKGKVVLASGPTQLVHNEAVWKRGAAGVISYFSTRVVPSDYPDQIAWSRIPDKPNDKGQEPAFAWMVSYRTGAALHQLLSGARTFDFLGGPPPVKPAGPLRVRVEIESEIAKTATQGIVEGWIRGSAIHDQQVVLTAHIQEEKYSANDDRSGVANVLEIGRALVKMIREGKLPRPQRDIRFWWANEIDAPYTWFAEHPEERKSIFVNINQDMVGANHTIGGLSRVQHVTRTLWSRPTFFNDVVESIVTALYQGNNAYISARQAGSLPAGEQYSEPIFSHLGSRDRYSIEIVPHFNNTDHMVFSDAAIGAVHGGTTFTNWPDEYIHSSDDDLWQMDRTTLKRNAVAVSALAWFMAGAGAKDVKSIEAMLLPGALARVQKDIRSALQASLEGGASVWDVNNVVEQSVRREEAVVRSVATVAPADRNVQAGVQRMTSRFQLAVAAVSEPLPVPAQAPAPQQPAGMARVAARREPLREYLKKLEEVRPVRALHGVMRYEALNLADGKRSIWEIYEILRAESLAAGEWYYGKVTPEAVLQYFENAAAAGAVVMKEPETLKPPPRKK